MSKRPNGDLTTIVQSATNCVSLQPNPVLLGDHGLANRHLGKYRVIKWLASGGFGAVYRAIDETRGQEVAIKTLLNVHPDGIASIKKEFRALAQVRHPNLVQLYEIGVEKEIWFLVMELVEGEDFLSFVRASSDGSPNLARLRMALGQLALAIHAIHAAGFLHLDIKPANVMVTPDGRVVLLDFGLVQHLRIVVEHQTRRRPQGTPAYMAPEQIAGDILKEPADWYGFGGILYQALTGNLPFLGNCPAQVFARKLAEEPSMSEHAMLVDTELANLAMALLSRDPCKRPPASEVFRSLRLSEAVDTVASRKPVNLSGRARELAKLRQAFELARQGIVVVGLSGPSGIGKSTLLATFVEKMRIQDGALALVSRCFERAHVPYRAFDGCVDELASILTTSSFAQIARAMDEQLAELTRIFPTLGRVNSTSNSFMLQPMIDLPADSRSRAFAALAAVLGCVAGEGVLILAFDDLQWADIDSQTLMTELLHSGVIKRTLVIAVHRSDLPRGPVVDALYAMAGHPQLQSFEHIHLGPLDEEQTIALIGQLGIDVDRERAGEIAQKSRGIPFLAEELVQRFCIDRFLSSSSGEAELEALILARLIHLPRAIRSIAELVALAGRPLSCPQQLSAPLLTCRSLST